MQIQPFMPHRTVESFDVRILCRLARLDIHQRDPSIIGPVNQRLRDLLRTVVQPYRGRLATPLDDLFQGAYYTLTRQ